MSWYLSGVLCLVLLSLCFGGVRVLRGGGVRLSGLLVVGSLRTGVHDLGEGVLFLDGGLVDCCFF